MGPACTANSKRCFRETYSAAPLQVLEGETLLQDSRTHEAQPQVALGLTFSVGHVCLRPSGFGGGDHSPVILAHTIFTLLLQGLSQRVGSTILELHLHFYVIV